MKEELKTLEDDAEGGGCTAALRVGIHRITLSASPGTITRDAMPEFFQAPQKEAVSVKTAPLTCPGMIS